MAEGTTTEATFTQRQVDAMVGNAVAAERAKFADYDDLKAAKEAADQQAEQQKTQLEQLTGKVTDLTDALARRDQDALRLKVAGDAKLTPQQAKFLTGTTEAELLASATEVRETFGLTDEPAGEGDEGAGDGGKPAGGAQAGLPSAGQHQRRPQELQAGGAPASSTEVSEMDPGKLADLIGTR